MHFCNFNFPTRALVFIVLLTKLVVLSCFISLVCRARRMGKRVAGGDEVPASSVKYALGPLLDFLSNLTQLFRHLNPSKFSSVVYC